MNGICILCKSKLKIPLYIIKGYPIVKCKQCNLIYTDPWPDKEQMKQFYEKFEFTMGFINENLVRFDARRTLKNIKHLGYKKGALLDLGCGPGFFLDEARKIGWLPMGTDTSKILVEYAIKQLHVHVVQNDIHDFAPKKKFDVITLLQVIEHINNPYPVLTKIRSLLNKKGLFCLSTPNISSLLAIVLKERFNYFIPPEHVLYFSPATLTRLLEKTGFKVIKTITYGYAEDFGAIYRALRSKGKKIKKDHVYDTEKNTIQKNTSLLKDLKHNFFENVIREYGYRFLNIGLKGSMIEMYVKKR